MKDFKTRFIKQLNETPVAPPIPDIEEVGDEVLDGNPGMTDQDAFDSTLDDPENSDDFNLDGRKAEVSNLQAQERDGQIGEIMGWITRMQETIEWLNGLGPESIQSKRSSADCDTLFAEVSKANTKKIGRIASEIASLAQEFGVYVNKNDDEAV